MSAFYFLILFTSVCCHIRTESTETPPSSSNGSSLSETSTIVPVTLDIGALEATVGYVFGDTAQNILFNPDSPFQYALHYDYTPLLSSIVTIVTFITSESSPGYVIATYDYNSLLQRLAPEFLTSLTRRYAVGSAGGIIATSLGVIVFSSIISFIVYIGVLVITTVGNIDTQEPTFARNVPDRSNRGRSLQSEEELLDEMAGKVLDVIIAEERKKRLQNDDLVLSWIHSIVNNQHI